MLSLTLSNIAIFVIEYSSPDSFISRSISFQESFSTLVAVLIIKIKKLLYFSLIPIKFANLITKSSKELELLKISSIAFCPTRSSS